MKSTLGTEYVGEAPRGRGTQRVRSFVGTLLLSDGGKVEQAISQVGLTFHVLSEASSSIVFNGCSEREPDSSLLNAELSGLADRLFEQECGLISCCLQSPVPPRRANFHPANTQATWFLSLQTSYGLCTRLLQYKVLSLTVEKSSRGSPKNTHLEAMGSTAHLSS